MKQLRELIKTDLFRFTGGKHFSFFRRIRLFGWRYMKTWRKTNFYRNNKLLYLFYGFFLHKKGYKFGFQISPNATIGKGFYIGHFGTLIIGDDVIIGDNVNVGVNVVIGRTNRGNKKGSPTIKNRVWIGSGSVIVGNICIGDNVLIAPNTFVNFDVPNDSLVIGNPGHIIHKENACAGYIEREV